MMHIAVVHYHLKQGGVTRVINNTVNSLDPSQFKVAVLSGGIPCEEAEPPCQTGIISELRYGAEPAPGQEKQVAYKLIKTAKAILGKDPDLWHFHNHSLGKNTTVPLLVNYLAGQGYPMLLQIHDFAEDSRSDNYKKLAPFLGEARMGAGKKSSSHPPFLYPQAPHVHYAVLTPRDYSFLLQSGVSQDRLHLLPNAIPGESQDVLVENQDRQSKDLNLTNWNQEWPNGNQNGSGHNQNSFEPAVTNNQAERLFLYPTRAIRRKNIGEFLLWAAIAREGDRFATTLAPQNPAAIPRYTRWVSLAKKLKLPVDFAVNSVPVDFAVNSGSSASSSASSINSHSPTGPANSGERFRALLHRSYTLVTTSIAEGFGLCFLEPWAADRPLAGRDLPEITEQLKSSGIDLSGLYSRLEVPLEWIDNDALKTRVREQLKAMFNAYGRSIKPGDLDLALSEFIHDGRVDFGRLDEEFQEEIIKKVSVSPGARGLLSPLELTPHQDSKEVVEHNRRITAHDYSLKQYGKQITTIYNTVANSSTGRLEGIENEKLLDCFLDPKRFFLLRTGL